jgi:hypothetical protein
MAEIEASKLHDVFSASGEHMHRVQDEFSFVSTESVAIGTRSNA